MSSSSSTTGLRTTTPTERIIAPNQPSLHCRVFLNEVLAKYTRKSDHFGLKTWNWLHCDKARDLVLCYICVNARIEGNVSSGHNDDDSHTTFSNSGYSNWKDATVNFKRHEHSDQSEQILHEFFY